MKQSKAALIAISLLAALGLSACDKPGPAEQAGKKLDEVASNTEKKAGETIDKLENKMAEQSAKGAQTGDDAEITAKVKGVVTLTGTVDSKANSDKAVARAMAISGVRNVVNQLVVTPA